MRMKHFVCHCPTLRSALIFRRRCPADRPICRPIRPAVVQACVKAGHLENEAHVPTTAPNTALLLSDAALVRTSSSAFHPPGVHVARMASGGRHGLCSRCFRSVAAAPRPRGPPLAAFVVFRYGQGTVAWFSLAALLGILPLVQVGHSYKLHGLKARAKRRNGHADSSPGRVALAMAVLLALVFSKFFHMASTRSYYTYYLRYPLRRHRAECAAVPVRVFGGGRRRHPGPAARSATGSGARWSYGVRSSVCRRSPCFCHMRTCSGPACSAFRSA